MAENPNGLSDILQKTANAANTVKSAVKLGKSIAAAAKGGAAGGWIGAVAAFAWENRRLLAIITVGIVVILLIPVMIICMLPSFIFGGFGGDSSSESQTIIMNDDAAIMENINGITTSLEVIYSEQLKVVTDEIDEDKEEITDKDIEVINPYSENSALNIYSVISQYSASKDKDYIEIDKSDLESIVSDHKDKIYTYEKKEETRNVEIKSITLDLETGDEVETVTIIPKEWVVYTVIYCGEDYFADEVFKLTEEQKRLAKEYAQNLDMYINNGI